MQTKITDFRDTSQKADAENLTQEEIGLIPEGWRASKLGALVECKKGRKPQKLFKVYKTGYLPYLTAEYFREGIAKQFVDVENEENIVQVSNKDIVLIWDGSNAGDVFTGLDGVLASTMVKIEPSNQLTKPFLYYFLKTRFTDLNEKTTGSTIPHVNVSKTVFKDLLVPVPPIPEQRKIAKVLGTIQRAIEQQDKIIKAAKNLKKSLMQKLFTEGLRGEEQKETEIGLIPRSWEVVGLGDIGNFQYGYTTSALKDAVGPKFLRITDIKNEGKISWEEVPYCSITKSEIGKYKLQDGDILIARIGATTGKTCIIKEAPEAIFASYLIRVQVQGSNKAYPLFVYYFTHTPIYWAQINANKEGKLKKGVSASFLKTLEIPLPPIDEQKEIAHMLSTVDEKIEVEEKKKATLNELFKTMLHKLMTVEIRLKDIEV